MDAADRLRIGVRRLARLADLDDARTTPERRGPSDLTNGPQDSIHRRISVGWASPLAASPATIRSPVDGSSAIFALSAAACRVLSLGLASPCSTTR
jgi:hypothetical protein